MYAYPLLKKYAIPATIFLTTDFIDTKQMFWWDKVFNIVTSLESDELEIYIDSEKYHFNLDSQVARRDIAKYINTILLAKDEKVIKAAVKYLEDEYRAAGKAGGYPILGWKEIREMKEGGLSFGSHTKTHRNLCLLRDDEILAELKGSKKIIEDALDTEISEFAYPFGIFDERVKRLVSQAGFSCARAISTGYNTRHTDMYYLNAVPAGLLLSAGSFAARCTSVLISKPEALHVKSRNSQIH
jgi:peptidoglycan/xylan/chitin deacetylase (PgdA/CDA1 family)